MGLETGTYIDDLVATNPTSGDLKSQGDDHIRLLKATIKASFPNVTGAATLTHGQLSGVSTPLTGVPTAPTATLGNDSTQIATTAYVDATTVAAIYPPVASGTSGKFITNDGTSVSWADVYTETEVDAALAALTTVPTGAVMAFIGGYFSNTANASFTSVIGNSASAINTLLNSSGFYVCNGAALNSADSSIFNGAARYLPNLTDDRFLMGDTAVGAIGGDNAMAHAHTGPSHTHTGPSHTHSVNIAAFNSVGATLSIAMLAAHTHTSYAHSGATSSRASGGVTDYPRNLQATSSTGSGSPHLHSVNPPNTTSTAAGTGATGASGTAATGAASEAENRPKFLPCHYIMKAV